MKVLVVEDETKTAAYLSKGLAENGFVVDAAYDGEAVFTWRGARTTTLSSSM